MSILLCIELDSLNDYLRDVYKETRYSHHAQWPPDQPKSVVSNTLIHYKDKRTERELLDFSKCHRGASSLDKIMSSHPSRVTKSIASIIESPDQKFILIEGAPGIGKTVLAKELSYHWAGGKLLQGNKFFLLFCRNPNLHDVDSINQKLVSYFSQNYLSNNEVDVVVDELRKSRGQNVVFVIDGFDECPVHCQLKLFVEKLAKHEILPKAIVVITSRPHASILFHPLADKRIEILGFAKEEREKYIVESFQEFPEKINELKRYLRLRPIIHSIMHVPLHLAVLLYLFKKEILPDTLTELNEQFVIHTVYRHLEKHLFSHLPYDKSITAIKYLPKPVKKLIDQLSELALKGLKERQIVFTYDEVKALCTDIDDFPNGFGLLQAVHSHVVKGAGYTVSFNFLHLTMQEFLAAYCISTLSSKKQSLLMAFHFNLGDYVWLMFVGIVGIESDGFTWYQSTVKLHKTQQVRKLLLFQCYLEAKKVVQVPKNVLFEDGVVNLMHTNIDSYTMVSLVNFLAKSCVHLRSLNLSSCSITDEKMTILQDFVTGYKENMCNVKNICLSVNYITSLWGIDSSNVVKNSESGLLLVPCLNLYSNELKDSGIVDLFTSLYHNTNLLQLDISNNGITSRGAVAISECLRNNKTLQELNISQNELLDDGVIAISDSLKVNCALKRLNIADNRISNRGAVNIADAIALNKALSELNISINFVTKEGIMSILKASSKTRALLKLDCLFNILSQSDFHALVKYSRYENVVQVFNSSWNKITSVDNHEPQVNTVICYGDGHDLLLCKQDGHRKRSHFSLISSFNYFSEVIYHCIKCVEKLSLEGSGMSGTLYLTMTAKAVQANRVLKSLQVINFSIDDNGVEAINDCLKVNTLKELHISCSFYFNGLKSIIETIFFNTALRKLNVSNNFLFSDAVKCLGVCLKQNNALQVLVMARTGITDSGALMVAEAIKVNTSLLVLDISQNKLTDVGILAISDSLKYNKQLQELYMSSDGILTVNSLLKFAEFSKMNVTLVKLELDYSQCNLKQIDIINCFKCNHTLMQIRICSFDFSNLHTLNVEYADWITSTSDQNFSYPQMATLNLRPDIIVHLKEKIVNLLAAVCNLINKKVLQTLKLLNCNFIEAEYHSKNSESRYYAGYEAIFKIIDTIKLSTTLTTLVISLNNLRGGGIPIIRDCIMHNTSLRELVLSHNFISSEGAVKIFEAIEGNKTICKLDISANEISDDASSAISECLNNNTTLRHLNIKDNNLYHEVNINGLKNNATLLEFHMDVLYRAQKCS